MGNLKIQRKPFVMGNTATLLAKVVEGMDAAAKRELGGRLDLQEPATALVRFSDAGGLGSPGQAIGESIPMVAMLVRMGDRDLIEGALRGPMAAAPRLWSRGRGLECCEDEISAIVLREAFAMADWRALELGEEVFDAVEPGLFARRLDLLARDGGSAVDHLARHADAHDYGDVKACADWAVRSHSKQACEMFVGAGDPGPKGAPSRRALAEAKRSAPRALLAMAAMRGSSNLAKAAMELGAKPGYGHAALAAQAGAPEMALAMWRAAAAIDARGKQDDRDSGFDWIRGWEGEKKVKDPRARALLALAGSAGNWADAARDPAPREGGVAAWIASDHVRRTLSELLMEVLMDRPGEGGEEALKAQRVLLACVMSRAEDFTDAGAIRARLRAAYPVPEPMELAALARQGCWEQLGTRVSDAESGGVDKAWREVALATLEAAARREKKESKEEGSAWDSMWSFKLAMALMEAKLGWSGELPFTRWADSGMLDKESARLLLMSLEEKALVAGVGAAGKPGRGSKRM